MNSFFSFTRAEFSEDVFYKLGRGRELAGRVYSEWFQKGEVRACHPAFRNGKQFLLELLQAYGFQLPLTPRKIKQEEIAFKFLSSTCEGLEVESVFLPMKSGGTLCISSQVGCAMGCAFCETGKMGLLRNLSAEEIVAQVFIARFIHKLDFRNLVFMGMGEPLDNFEALTQALRILIDPAGLNFPPKRITVSTCGRVLEMEKMGDANFPKVNLAVSINAPSDQVRNKLMPVNRSFDMTTLKEAMAAYIQKTGKQILAEYVLIKGWTDSLDDAKNLSAYLKGLNIKLNLIPLNPGRRTRFEAPTEEEVFAFAKRMKEEGFPVLVRHNKGQNIMAACGQLGNQKRRFPVRSPPQMLSE